MAGVGGEMQSGKEIVEKGSACGSPRGPMTPRLDHCVAMLVTDTGDFISDTATRAFAWIANVRSELSLDTSNGEQGNKRNGWRKRVGESEIMTIAVGRNREEKRKKRERTKRQRTRKG